MPDKFYGDSEADQYQNTDGIKESARLIPADIPDRLVVKRSERKLDPIKQLTQAGYPFNHIGTELIELQGKWEVVSKDIAVVKEGFANLQSAIGSKIEHETGTLSKSISDLGEKLDAKISHSFAEQFNLYFDQRMQRVLGIVLTLFTFVGALYKALIQPASPKMQVIGLLVLGALFFAATMLLTRPRKPAAHS